MPTHATNGRCYVLTRKMVTVRRTILTPWTNARPGGADASRDVAPLPRTWPAHAGTLSVEPVAPCPPDEVTRNSALNDRCWTRARLGTELDKALDCDGAINSKATRRRVPKKRPQSRARCAPCGSYVPVGGKRFTRRRPAELRSSSAIRSCSSSLAKSANVTPKQRTHSYVSVVSSLRTPFSTFVTTVRSTPRALASSSCVMSAATRAWRSMLRKIAAYFCE